MKVREVVWVLREDGWYLATIPGSMNDDLAAGTLNSILKQVSIARSEAGDQLPRYRTLVALAGASQAMPRYRSALDRGAGEGGDDGRRLGV